MKGGCTIQRFTVRNNEMRQKCAAIHEKKQGSAFFLGEWGLAAHAWCRDAEQETVKE